MAVDLIKEIETATKELLDKLPPRDATFENAGLSMAKIDNNIKNKAQFLAFFRFALSGATPSILGRCEHGRHGILGAFSGRKVVCIGRCCA
jgi:hypothetical protein